MEPFHTESAAARILEKIRKTLPVLGLTTAAGANRALVDEIARLDDEALLGAPAVDAAMAASVRAGLLTRADIFDEAHEVSQAIATPTGSYWHGILHRREPDPGNARYWFQRVGRHPVFAELLEAASREAASAGPGSPLRALQGKSAWDPFLWIDLCESGAGASANEAREALLRIQEAEISLLLRFSHRRAVG